MAELVDAPDLGDRIEMGRAQRARVVSLGQRALCLVPGRQEQRVLLRKFWNTGERQVELVEHGAAALGIRGLDNAPPT